MVPRNRARDDGESQPLSSVRTRSMRKAGSRAVFLTTELLESILLQLPMRDLLLVQRVCRKWRDVITTSKPLQQALFFVPTEPRYGWKFERKSPNQLVRVELAPENKPQYKGTKPKVFYGGGCPVHGHIIFRNGELNPLLFRNLEDVPRKHPIDMLEGDAPGQFGFVKWPLSSNAEASWRKMLVIQPPEYRYEVGEKYPFDDKSWFVRGPQLSTDGTAGAIADEMDVDLQNWGPRSEGKVDWRVGQTAFFTNHVLYLTQQERDMEVIRKA